MDVKQLPAVSDLHKVLVCDERTGHLQWLSRPLEFFADGVGRYTAVRSQKIWNARYAGKIAFNTPDGNGYLMGRLFNRGFFAHRVIWAMVHGEWPDGQIDHINQIKTDNRVSNLRVVTNAENGKNMSMSKKNTSGVTGVHFDKRHKYWVAYITVDGNRKHLGSFTKKTDAITARLFAEIGYKFSDIHGRSLK